MATATSDKPIKAKDSEAEAVEKADAEPTTAAESGTVKYTGDSGVREITKAQWKQAGVEDQETTIWDESNNYELPLSLFNNAALELLARQEPKLKIKRAG